MPASLEIRIVPGPPNEPDRRAPLPVLPPPVGVKRLDNGTDVSDRRSCCVGVSAIGDHLDVSLHAGEKPPFEVLIDLNDQ